MAIYRRHILKISGFCCGELDEGVGISGITTCTGSTGTCKGMCHGAVCIISLKQMTHHNVKDGSVYNTPVNKV